MGSPQLVRSHQTMGSPHPTWGSCNAYHLVCPGSWRSGVNVGSARVRIDVGSISGVTAPASNCAARPHTGAPPANRLSMPRPGGIQEPGSPPAAPGACYERRARAGPDAGLRPPCCDRARAMATRAAAWTTSPRDRTELCVPRCCSPTPTKVSPSGVAPPAGRVSKRVWVCRSRSAAPPHSAMSGRAALARRPDGGRPLGPLSALAYLTGNDDCARLTFRPTAINMKLFDPHPWTKMMSPTACRRGKSGRSMQPRSPSALRVCNGRSSEDGCLTMGRARLRNILRMTCTVHRVHGAAWHDRAQIEHNSTERLPRFEAPTRIGTWSYG